MEKKFTVKNQLFFKGKKSGRPFKYATIPELKLN